VWLEDLSKKTGLSWLVLACLRLGLHALGNFNHHLLGIRAAGLTMVTLFALVPMLAFGFSIADSLGYGEFIHDWLETQAADLPEQMGSLVLSLRDLMERTSFAALGWLSSLILLYTGYSLFEKVEQALNHAWQTGRGRRWLRRLTDFVALVVFVPLLVLLAIILQSVLRSADWTRLFGESYPWIATLYDSGIGFLPYLLIWLAFIALYKFMPNARVRWIPAIIAGVFAGTLCLIANGIYIYFQVGVARLNAIYATLAALPLLLVYLELAWAITLLGAELSYGIQNLNLLGRGRRLNEAGPALRERLGLWLVARACSNFGSGRGQLRIAELAAELEVSGEIIELAAEDLSEAGILLEIEGDDPGYMPARLPEQISAESVREAIRGELPKSLLDRLCLPAALAQRLDRVEGLCREQLESLDFKPRDAAV
jgi:membrane protein